jgi:hypothetical protein
MSGGKGRIARRVRRGEFSAGGMKPPTMTMKRKMRSIKVFTDWKETKTGNEKKGR